MSLENLAIKAAIYEVGLLFNQAPSEEKINAYAKALVNYSPKQITFAFNQVILSGSQYFPSLAEVLVHLRPPVEKKEDRAPVIAKEIIQLLRSWHRDLEEQMLQAASPDARLVLERIGNTTDLRESENFETMNAQLERFIRGVLSGKEAGAKILKLESIGIATGVVKPLANPKATNMIAMKHLSFDEFMTDDPA